MDKKYIALTFDDGPNNIVTPAVLDRLEKYNVNATFFVNGKYISDETKSVMQRALRLNCEYQNHSQNHFRMNELSKEEIIFEIEKTDMLIKKYTGTVPAFFRPPCLAVNDLMFETIDKVFTCGQSSCDWDKSEKKEDTARIILSDLKNGDIILLHDSYYNMKTAEALDIIIPELLNRGFEFVTVSKLFSDFGVENKKGVVFSGAFREKVLG